MSKNVLSGFEMKSEAAIVDGEVVTEININWKGKPEQLLEVYAAQLPKVQKFVGALFGYMTAVKEMAKAYTKTDEAPKPDDTPKPADADGEVQTATTTPVADATTPHPDGKPGDQAVS